MSAETESGAAFLDVGEGHSIYYEDVGSGVPAVFLHGGPGSGFRREQRALFDAACHRIVMFDQRGAGKSRPPRSLIANTTDHLIADMEALRRHLGIERWIVVGGSWGATLAVAYAERHPERTAGIVLRALFLGTDAELQAAFGETLRRFRPELYRDFVNRLPEAERSDHIRAYWRRILDPDPAIHTPAIIAWHDTERALSETAPRSTRLQPEPDAPPAILPATPLMEAHYFSHGCFLKPGQLLTDAHTLTGIPGEIVQGRYDLLCPPETSAALAALWPDATITIVERAGHAMSEPGIIEAMSRAITRVADRAGL